MPRLFLTKVWGFEPEIYPALGFNSEGGRLKFQRESEPGDWVVLAGTLTDDTSVDDQGRLLGRVQLGTEEIGVEEVLRSVGYAIPDNQYNGKREYRWPFGLPVISAVRFPGKPDLRGVLGSYLSGKQWAAYALDVREHLGADAVAKLEALPTEQANIISAPAIIRQRQKQRALSLNRGLTGPPPSMTRSSSERIVAGGFVYLLELERARDVFKIGYAADPQIRLEVLNKPLIPSITGYRWNLVFKQGFEHLREAYDFEQILHQRLRQHVVDGEREIYRISRKELDRAWQNVFQDGEWAVRAASVADAMLL